MCPECNPLLAHSVDKRHAYHIGIQWGDQFFGVTKDGYAIYDCFEVDPIMGVALRLTGDMCVTGCDDFETWLDRGKFETFNVLED
jgi:hypothetical protein